MNVQLNWQAAGTHTGLEWDLCGRAQVPLKRPAGNHS